MSHKHKVKIEKLFESKRLLFEEKGATGTDNSWKEGDEKGRLETYPDWVEIDLIVENSNAFGTFRKKPVERKSLPRQGREYGVVEGEYAGDQQWGKKKNKKPDYINLEAGTVAFALR